MSKYRRLSMFDFDGTLFRSDETAPEWWPEGGFSWGMDPISLGPPCVPKRPEKSHWNTSVLQRAKELQNSPDTMVVLVSGRVRVFLPRIKELLSQQGLRPDALFMNPGLEARKFKIGVLFRLLEENQDVRTVLIWDNENTRYYKSSLLQYAARSGRDLVVKVVPVKIREIPVQCQPEEIGLDPIQRIASRWMRANMEQVEEFVEGFFKRHPKLRKYQKIKIQDATGVGGHHPEADQRLGKINLYPKFWKWQEREQDFMLAHEIGHWVHSEFGLARMISEAESLGIDMWDPGNLPFGQSNMQEAFADSFASYFTDKDVLRRYPAWAQLVETLYRVT